MPMGTWSWVLSWWWAELHPVVCLEVMELSTALGGLPVDVWGCVHMLLLGLRRSSTGACRLLGKARS